MVLPWSPFNTNGFHPIVSPNLLPLFFQLAHCSFGTSSRRRSCLCQTLAHRSPCTSFYSEVQVARDWGRFTYGPTLPEDEYILCLLCSPKGALDTSFIRLPHTTLQPLVQTPGQLPGLGQRLFVKENQSHVCPCQAELSCLLSTRKQWHTNLAFIFSSSNNPTSPQLPYVL